MNGKLLFFCSDSCILLRTLISTSNANQGTHSSQPVRSEGVRKPATFSPQILVVNVRCWRISIQVRSEAFLNIRILNGFAE